VINVTLNVQIPREMVETLNHDSPTGDDPGMSHATLTSQLSGAAGLQRAATSVICPGVAIVDVIMVDVILSEAPARASFSFWGHESPDRRSVSTARPGRAPFLDPAPAPAEPVGTEFEGCREPAGPNIALERRDRSAAHVGCAPPAGDDRIVAERSGIGCIDHVISRN